MKKSNFSILFTVASLFFLKTYADAAAAPSSADAAPPIKAPAASAGPALPQIALALPDNISPAISWVSPPIDPKQLQAAHWQDLHFSVGPTGQIWIGHDHQVVADSISQIQFELSQPYQDFTYLKNGVLMFCTDKELGVIPKAKFKTAPSGRLLAPFQPLAAIPIENCRLFSNENGAFYVTGYNRKTASYEAYLIPLKAAAAGGKIRYQWEFQRVFSSPEPIAALAGDGTITYAAIGPLLVKIKNYSGKSEGLLRHPNGPIKSLVLSPKAGLFYATDSEVGFINPETKYFHDFFKSPNAQLALSAGNLYVLLSENLGIFRLDHLERFALK